MTRKQRKELEARKAAAAKAKAWAKFIGGISK